MFINIETSCEQLTVGAQLVSYFRFFFLPFLIKLYVWIIVAVTHIMYQLSPSLVLTTVS